MQKECPHFSLGFQVFLLFLRVGQDSLTEALQTPSQGLFVGLGGAFLSFLGVLDYLPPLGVGPFLGGPVSFLTFPFPCSIPWLGWGSLR